MGKPNKRHNELCKKYKTEGRKDKNKALRAIKNEKRVARFAKRKAEKPSREVVLADPENRGTNKMEPLGDFAYRPKMEHMLPYSRTISAMRRVQNQLDAEIQAEKKQEQEKKTKTKNNKEGND